MLSCPVCGSSDCRELSTPRRKYRRCEDCAFVFADADSRPSAEAARRRYSLHRNDEGDAGYVSYLSAIIERSEEAGRGAKFDRVADWGSGPVPVCSRLLRDRGYRVDSWDPHFCADAELPKNVYDAVFCVEVAEHFESPRADFSSMASRLRPGGFLFVHTHFAPPDDSSFLDWWYQEDPTHVSFYSIDSLRVLAAEANLVPVSFSDDRFAVFRRPLPVLVAGGANWDIEGRPFAPLVPRDSNPGIIRFSPGGAGRNIAEDLSRLGAAVELVSAVGCDAPGREVLDRTSEAGVGVSGVLRMEGAATSSYLAILDSDGDMAAALSGMTLYDGFGPDFILSACASAEESARAASLLREGEVPFSAVVVDGNLLPESARAVLLRYPDVPSWLDPVSTAKAIRFASFGGGSLLPLLSAMKPNLVEAEAMCSALGTPVPEGASGAERANFAASILRGRGTGTIYLSMGASGVLWAGNAGTGSFCPPPIQVVSATGAGDSFLASAVRASILYFEGLDVVLRGAAASSVVLASTAASSAELSSAAIEDSARKWSRT